MAIGMKISMVQPPPPFERAGRVECARQVCRRQSADPPADAWQWIVFDPEPPQSGWWCTECTDALRELLAAVGARVIGNQPGHA